MHLLRSSIRFDREDVTSQLLATHAVHWKSSDKTGLGLHYYWLGFPPYPSLCSYTAQLLTDRRFDKTINGTSTETYDLNGNLATTTDAGVPTTYTWNARNQLTGISRTGLTASFSYDSFGRRTGRTVNGAVINYVYDGLNPV